MIIVRIKGGLGNQLFQYVAVRYLQLHLGNVVSFDLVDYSFPNLFEKNDKRYYYLDKFGLIGCKVSILWCLFFRMIGALKRIIPSNVTIKSLDTILKKYKKNSFIPLYVDDYFQTREIFNLCEKKYKLEIENKLLSINKGLNITEEYEKTLDSVKVNPALQIRRGDYISNVTNREILGFCDNYYFDRAIAKLPVYGINQILIVFTDQPDSISDNTNFCLVSKLKLDLISEFFLLSMAKNIIISNSTFGWWAAYLFDSDSKTVVAPIKWFKNLSSDLDHFPASWIRLDCHVGE